MNTVIVLAVLAAVIFFAVKGALPHFKGEGACCGGGGASKKIKPQRLQKVIAVRTVRIGGMVCDSCEKRVHNALNSIDGINAVVSRSRGRAVVKLGRPIDDADIKKVITDLGYTVKEIV